MRCSHNCRAWANPTKFLLTTRHRLLSEADIHHFALPELGQADTLALLATRPICAICPT